MDVSREKYSHESNVEDVWFGQVEKCVRIEKRPKHSSRNVGHSLEDFAC